MLLLNMGSQMDRVKQYYLISELNADLATPQA